MSTVYDCGGETPKCSKKVDRIASFSNRNFTRSGLASVPGLSGQRLTSERPGSGTVRAIVIGMWLFMYKESLRLMVIH